MKRLALVVMVAAVMVAMIATLGASASAQSPSQSPCPPTGPSGGLATLVIPERPVGAGFVCLDEGAQEFFCPAEFELQLIPILPPGPGFIAECVEQLSPPPPSLGGDVGSGGGGVELPQEIGQGSQSGTVNISHNVSNEPG